MKGGIPLQTTYKIGKYQFEYQEKFSVESGFPFIPHFHDCYEIYLFKQGTGHYMVEGKNYPLAPGDVVITNPKEVHCPYITSDVYHRTTLSIHPLYLSGFITKNYNPFHALSGRALGDRNHIAADIVRENGLDREIEIIGTYHKSDRPCRDALIKAHLLILLESINGIISVEKRKSANERIHEIIHYINEHLDEKISLSTLSEVFFLNKHHLSHSFHDYMGMTLTEYITSKRIQKSLEIIGEPLSLLEVALTSGFTDYTGFYRAFMRVTGTSPMSYRKTLRDGDVKKEQVVFES